jgi:hypothetical protein
MALNWKVSMKNELIEIATELAEFGLDSQLTEGFDKDLPIVGLIYKIGKTAISIPDLLLAAKVKKFLNEVEKIDSIRRDEFRKRLERDPDLAQKTGQAVLLSIDAADELEKAKVIGVLFTSYVNEEVTEEDFRRMLFAVNRIFLDDLRNFVLTVAADRGLNYVNFPELSGTPLVQAEYPVLKDLGLDEAAKTRFVPTSLGRRLSQVLQDWAAT